MSFLMPLIVMNLVLLVITVLLALADRLLVTYGECRITVRKEDGEERVLTVQGGSYLLTHLTDNNVEVSSSCGGKGSCGYCKVKVLSGGGQILPTEEIFMSRQERQDGMRLACQVKVKTDIELSVPDFLTVVRQMVLNKKFDPNKRWRVTIR
jgi:Na+-transporting NADH:ubiquinone oxidoreductase subunit F